jgi:hypothetical protein
MSTWSVVQVRCVAPVPLSMYSEELHIHYLEDVSGFRFDVCRVFDMSPLCGQVDKPLLKPKNLIQGGRFANHGAYHDRPPFTRCVSPSPAWSQEGSDGANISQVDLNRVARWVCLLVATGTMRARFRYEIAKEALPPRRRESNRSSEEFHNSSRNRPSTKGCRVNASTMPGTRRYRPTIANRSKVPKTNLLGALRCSTLS